MNKQLTPDDRKRTLDRIVRHADHLTEVARRYDRLRYMAEKDCSDAFLMLADCAGDMACAQLDQLATMLEIMLNTKMHEEAEK